jgi:3-carboxy-cis,cis-muconate cycloisomerase
MAGRTHLQHALPITFGMKCALWLAPLIDHLERLAELRPRALRLQFAGAVGTLASLGDKGRAVVEGLAEELNLAAPVAPWHAQRESVAELVSYLGLVGGTLAKFATDVALLMQSELGEVFEPHQQGRGGSSTMPQKRNPIAAEYIIAAARGVQAMVPLMQNAIAADHERATGPWQAEWIALPQAFVLVSGALQHAIDIAEGMTVDTERMRRNLDATGGLIMAEAVMMKLAETIGRGEAHRVVGEASSRALERRQSLAEVLREDPRLAGVDVDALVNPSAYLGESGAIVDRVIERAAPLFN